MNNQVANIGDEIQCIGGLKGIVEKVYSNSVMVNILENTSDNEYLFNKTVISHKKYLIVSKT